MTACLPSMSLASTQQSALSAYRSPAGLLSEASLASSVAAASGGIQRTQHPIVTGASVLAVKYADGVMLMADTMGSYGSMGMFKALQRIHQVNPYTVLGASGEYSDLQYILKLLEQLRIADFAQADGAVMTPAEVHSYLGRVMYNRRSKVDPLWNQLITAGFYNGKPFLGMTDMYGSTYEADLLATGYGLHLAIPLLRKHQRNDQTAEEARKLLEECMKVLYYRDCRTLNSFQVATITKDGASISKPFSVETSWELKRQVQPFRAD